jgi:VCBS repeat-containing protein
MVRCDGLQQSRSGWIATLSAKGAPRGLVMFFSESGGGEWLTTSAKTLAMTMNLSSRGLTVVQVRWKEPWLASAQGEDAGTAHLGCRPAGVIKWTYDHYYVPMGIPKNAAGHCGFCIAGVSGGSTAVSLMLSHFGMEDILNAVIPISGPPHAAMAKGCNRDPGEKAYWYSTSIANTMDLSFGYLSGNSGPCIHHDSAWTPRWQTESPDVGGSDYFHPATRVHFIFGKQDGTSAPRHGQDYADRLMIEGNPLLSVTTLPGVGHEVEKFDAGVAEIQATVLANDAPVAANDSYSTNEDSALNVPAPGVLVNDTDLEGNTLIATPVTSPNHGTLSLNADGSFSYMPNADFAGIDSFTYKANDGLADSNVATVTITVAAGGTPAAT